MSISADTQKAVSLLENIQQRLQSSEPGVQLITEDLRTLIGILENPVFKGILNIQESLKELRRQLHQHPSILPIDFDITANGELILNLPPAPDPYDSVYDPERGFQFDVPTLSLRDSLHSREKQSQQLKSPSQLPSDYQPATVSTYPYTLEFQRAIEQATHGREVHTVRLYRPEGSSLGFSVVGLRSEQQGELGIYVQEIQPSGIAATSKSNGIISRCAADQGESHLQEGDQIIAIDGQPLDANISHQQAIHILQQSRGLVELVVARGSLSAKTQAPATPVTVNRSSSAVSDSSKASDMVLNTEWAQVDIIDLVNDGSGLGFGIVGGRSTGVVVKTILPGGVADRDGRLQSGDHILQIGDVNLRGMASEQVAAVLRQSGSHVRLVVARPIEPTSPDYQQVLHSHAPIVQTRILSDPEELERQLALLQAQNGFSELAAAYPGYDQHFVFNVPMEQQTHVELHPHPELASSSFDDRPETESFTIELVKDQQGLGITIAGYVYEKEDISGIFVKSITEGSAAAVDGRIHINDQIIEVDGENLQGYSNHQAVEVLRNTGKVVQLKLVRYMRGSKYEQLQLAIANSELQFTPPPATAIVHQPSSPDLLPNAGLAEATNANIEVEPLKLVMENGDGLLAEIESAENSIVTSWQTVLDPDYLIVVAQISKFQPGGSLGISLEGTVDVEAGRDVRPHHYIGSILPDGPVGVNGKLQSGDELLEVNGTKLYGLNHVDVVAILKDLPLQVQMVCARNMKTPASLKSLASPAAASDWLSDAKVESLPPPASHSGSLQNLVPIPDRLFKAKSDGSLAVIPSSMPVDNSFSKLKSRSLEPLTGLAMWSSEPQMIELIKGDRGLGFSILDYQDPMNPNETVIVIRSLVPGGVAQQDGRLIPGDRLILVNNINLENASLDQAVQALKGAPKGVVRIGVAKPLPLPESSHNGQVGELDDGDILDNVQEGISNDHHLNRESQHPHIGLLKSESL